MDPELSSHSKTMLPMSTRPVTESWVEVKVTSPQRLLCHAPVRALGNEHVASVRPHGRQGVKHHGYSNGVKHHGYSNGVKHHGTAMGLNTAGTGWG